MQNHRTMRCGKFMQEEHNIEINLALESHHWNSHMAEKVIKPHSIRPLYSPVVECAMD